MVPEIHRPIPPDPRATYDLSIWEDDASPSPSWSCQPKVTRHRIDANGLNGPLAVDFRYMPKT